MNYQALKSYLLLSIRLNAQDPDLASVLFLLALFVCFPDHLSQCNCLLYLIVCCLSSYFFFLFRCIIVKELLNFHHINICSFHHKVSTIYPLYPKYTLTEELLESPAVKQETIYCWPSFFLYIIRANSMTKMSSL